MLMWGRIRQCDIARGEQARSAQKVDSLPCPASKIVIDICPSLLTKAVARASWGHTSSNSHNDIVRAILQYSCKMGIPTRAYVVDKKGAPFVLRDVVLDALQPDELLVEIKYTGLCHTVGLRPWLDALSLMNTGSRRPTRRPPRQLPCCPRPRRSRSHPAGGLRTEK